MLIPVILSGGAGTRLWPVSREGHPKPFMKLADGQSLLAKTYRRALQVQTSLDNEALPAEMLTVTNRDYYFMSRDEQDLSGVCGDFVLEPFGRNTAPAVAIAAYVIQARYGADALMLVLAADHLIQDQSAFNQAVSAAAELAAQDYLVTFGVVPTAPETGFGYIEQGEALALGFKVARFVEKPDLETATGYLASGNFLWNSGMFCFKAGVFLDELQRHSPEIATAVTGCWSAMQSPSNPDVLEIPAAGFATVPDLSVDYAVMERSDRVAVVPGNFGWSDIGSWNAVRDLAPPDQAGNRVLGDAILIDSENTYVQAEDRLVATVGTRNLMVVDTPDALLIVDPDKAQHVKQVVTRLKKTDSEVHRLHRTVVRPWGTYTVLEDSAHFKIKRIEVKAGGSLSLQMHHHRSEHWVVVSGVAKVINGDQEILVKRNESTYIPAGQRHRLENPGSLPCVMIEVQCGDYLGEDDIVRFEDSYGRK
jgi:mannose-1-phosphate guanylyltransferase / mannose-6-phosphate isomerase